MRLNPKHKSSRSLISFITPRIQVDNVVVDTQQVEEQAQPTVVTNFTTNSTPPEPPEKSHKDILTAQARISAKKCFEEDETFIKKELIAEFLGSNKKLNSLALKFYMEYFDFSNLRLDVAFRRLCGKLYIKGETQQVDRILEQFSKRYWECNPKSVYGSSDVIHAISYSILLLNTDLHIAQVANKMSRSQFVRNTMSVVHAQTNLLAKNNNGDKESYEDDCSTITSIETFDNSETSLSITTPSSPSRSSSPLRSQSRRSESLRGWRSNSNLSLTNLSFIPGVLSRQWDMEIEGLLKEMYSAIKADQILQPFITSDDDNLDSSSKHNNAPGLQRSLSQLGRPTRLAALKKSLAANHHHNSHSKDNNNNNKDSSNNMKISPSPSFVSGGSSNSDANSNRNSLYHSNSSQTLQTPLSPFSSSHASSSETVFTPESAGKDNNNHVKFSEKNIDNGNNADVDNDDQVSVTDSVLTDESLELYLSGAPYAKEGLLFRKHYRESTNKRSKDKNWKECFVVVEKGELRLYKFDTQNSSNSAGFGAMGGGNWMENATVLGEINLCHTITNALPPPGYNRSRPHVFALTLSNGGLFFFQAGTAELVEEWVSTCNYWAARMSKEPLTGGVSNIEYGWGRCLDLTFDGDDNLSDDNKSIMSTRTTIGFGHGSSSGSFHKILIHEWKPPLPPSVPSNLNEELQLAALKKYRVDLENDLEQHKNYWEPMSKVFTIRSTNNSRAFANWEKKSQWLLYEIIKYTTYIESLENSISLKAQRHRGNELPPLEKFEGIDLNAIISTKDGAKTSDEEMKKEQERAEFRARARRSVQMLHRATWTPGDGFSLNLPKELLFADALNDDDNETDSNGNSNDGSNNNNNNSGRDNNFGSIGNQSDNGINRGQKRSKSAYATPEARGIIEEETRIGEIKDFEYEFGYKWVDRFA